MNTNNDYTYIYRMMSARKRAEQDYAMLRRQSENIIACTFILCIDVILAIFAWLVFYI